MTNSSESKSDYRSIYKLTSLDEQVKSALGQEGVLENDAVSRASSLEQYRAHIRKMIREEVRKSMEVEMQRAAQELQDEQRKAIKSILEDHRAAIRQVVEEEKASIRDRADQLRESIMKLGE